MTTAQQDASTAAPRDLTDVAELRQRAQEFVRDYIAKNHRQPTGELVGRQFGMKERWGRNQIDAVRGTASGTRSGTVGEAVAARGGPRSGTASGTATAARASFPASATAVPQAAPAARPPAPPPQTGTALARPSGTAPARPTGATGTTDRHDTGKASARATGTESAHDSPRPGRFAGWIASGQLIAWLGFAFGSAVSILGNVMDAYIPPVGWVSPDGAPWAPSTPSLFGAAVWPVALLLSVEILSRVQWAKGFWWGVARFGGVGVVGAGSAIISFGHLHHLLVAWGYTPAGAVMGPISVDGLMVISGFALLSISQASRREGKS